ncbi:HdeD family acid-resistance protein [Lachnospira sp.]|jgi:uncharacterized membrane protein HdeD (DUF308 family)|uniref:HdeD family acid-resistance protein n=1 Tax=Lachnospira sp. TaxID=2049031 RepID=UPI002579AB5A|nr:DUF308 domain-containing protein [Lachnospira sp.]
MDKILQKIKTVINEIILLSIALIVVGVYLIIEPMGAQIVICRIFGALFLVWGVLRVITYFKTDKSVIFASFGLVQGLTLIFLGLFFIINPVEIAAFFGIILSIVVMINGVLMIQYAIELKRLNSPSWWLEILSGILMLILGVVALVNPFATSATLMVFIGVILIYEGIVNLVSVLRITSIAKQVEYEVKDAVNKVKDEFRPN